MKIGFFKLGLDKPNVNAIFGGMYQDYFSALERQGLQVDLYADNNGLDSECLVLPVGSNQEIEGAKVLKEFTGPVILYVPRASRWFDKNFLRKWHDRILFVYSTDVSGFSDKEYQELGIVHYPLAFGSDPQRFFPIEMRSKCDVLFLANASSGSGRMRFVKLLCEKATKENWRINLIGKGWDALGFSPQIIAYGDATNRLYHSAKICINLMNDEQNIPGKALDSNNRLFDLAMAGCFQVSNAPKVVCEYFAHDEVVAKETPEEWVGAIEYYLRYEDKKLPYIERARRRALGTHTWDHRARQFLGCINEQLPLYKERPPFTGQDVEAAGLRLSEKLRSAVKALAGRRSGKK